MTQPNIHISFDEFVAPLQLAMGMMEAQLQTLLVQEMGIQSVLNRQLEAQKTLPTTTRNQYLFRTEEQIAGIRESIQRMRHEHLTTLRELDQSAQNVLQHNPPYRERVLGMILEARKLSQGLVYKLEQMDEHIDVKMSELINDV